MLILERPTLFSLIFASAAKGTQSLFPKIPCSPAPGNLEKLCCVELESYFVHLSVLLLYFPTANELFRRVFFATLSIL